MIDNFDLITDLLDFSMENTFYFVQILKRRKENPNMEKGTYVLDNFYVYEKSNMEKIKSKIIDRCEKHNARAYINLNRLDLEKIAMHSIKQSLEYVMAGEFKKVKNSYQIACGSHTMDPMKKWVVDVDTLDELALYSIIPIINELHEEIPNRNYKVIATIPTKNGFHIITNPFNIKEFNERTFNMKYVSVQKNSPTVLYIP